MSGISLFVSDNLRVGNRHESLWKISGSICENQLAIGNLLVCIYNRPMSVYIGTYLCPLESLLLNTYQHAMPPTSTQHSQLSRGHPVCAFVAV